MECPYLNHAMEEGLCKASVVTRPRVSEKDSYCTTEEHYKCPTLLGHILRAGRKWRNI